MLECWQPLPGSHVSVVQAAPSSQSRSSSSWHPATGSQLSVPLQTLPSLQSSGVPGWQRPVASAHVSVPVQSEWSSQSASAWQQPGIAGY